MHGYLYTQVYQRLCEARKLVFIADERLDGDSLGSSLALADHLTKLGKRVMVYVSRPVPEKYQFLPGASMCTSDPAIFHDPEVDTVASFDCSDGHFINGLVSEMRERPFVVNIDHHATNPLYGDLNLVAVESPATCEVVYQLLKAAHVVPSKEAATCLLCGICFDTTVFFNDGTNALALEAASDLVLFGARVQDVIRTIFRNRTVAALRIWGIALERLRRHPELGFVATCITRQDMETNDVTDDEVDGLSDFLNVVINAETFCVLRETHDGGVKVSMRTSTQNVANLARAFGGGGHVKAAGFTTPNSRLTLGADGRWQVEEKVAA